MELHALSTNAELSTADCLHMLFQRNVGIARRRLCWLINAKSAKRYHHKAPAAWRNLCWSRQHSAAYRYRELAERAKGRIQLRGSRTPDVDKQCEEAALCSEWSNEATTDIQAPHMRCAARATLMRPQDLPKPLVSPTPVNVTQPSERSQRHASSASGRLGRADSAPLRPPKGALNS
jgi:hypothetical protein